ncbi:MarR family winged helix-turn-helix transcriptional regulator [Bacillus alveayuensis]|jgi:MarR family transcriptional regulator, organic hydroperoxide resistance regulator|uniref:MarR family winged helix-turn-helix transcriptional regulator n=1 Tax=Aeribacillus alveayuensis TaxID=279215 RepID=UPI0005CD8B84|nr:MarR family transcriptional regulator [Bacillus alveayuensis]
MNDEMIEQYIARLETAFQTAMRHIVPQLNTDITPVQFFILKIVEQSKRCTPSQLAGLLNVKPSAITTMINRLVKHEYVHRERDEQDRRVVFISLSEKGKKVLHETEEKRRKVMKQYLSHLTEEELKQFVSIYEKLTHAIITGGESR